MFHGQPYCRACGYEGPNFMWTHHFGWGVGVLVQDVTSLELRVIEVPDDRALLGGRHRNHEEAAETWQSYVSAFVACELRPGERPVPVAELGQLPEEGRRTERTELPCPRCQATLSWRHTGIS